MQLDVERPYRLAEDVRDRRHEAGVPTVEGTECGTGPGEFHAPVAVETQFEGMVRVTELKEQPFVVDRRVQPGEIGEFRLVQGFLDGPVKPERHSARIDEPGPAADS